MAEVQLSLSESGRAFVRARGEVVRRKVTREVGRDARRYAPVDTGKLRGSITVHPEVGEVRVSAPYWAAQEYGADEHLIDGAFGREGWAGIVVHPGNAAQPYMRPALYTYRRDLR